MKRFGFGAQQRHIHAWVGQSQIKYGGKCFILEFLFKEALENPYMLLIFSYRFFSLLSFIHTVLLAKERQYRFLIITPLSNDTFDSTML